MQEEKGQASLMSQPPKKKRAQDQQPSTDAGQKPVQLQRRRVWRACENCRRKKIKCDGTEPVCSQCSSGNAQCTWLQTKDRAALSRHYVQELEARLMHMEEVFKQVAPIVEVIEKAPNGGQAPVQSILAALKAQNGAAANQQQQQSPSPPNTYARRERASSEQSTSPMPKSPSVTSSKEEEEVSDAFGQLALDDHGHLRWIGGSSTMSLIQSFRALTTSPLSRVSPAEEDPHSPGPSANKLYFPASVYFGNFTSLPGADEVEYPERDLADKLVDAFFTRLHFLIPVVDKPSFLDAYKELMDSKRDARSMREKTPFISLVFAIFACAARVVDDPRLRVGDESGRGMVYYERALVLHYISHASIQMAHVQCIVLLSSFLCAVNCLPQAWLLVGQAVRMAQDLGLHRFTRHASITPLEKQVRRKVFWSVYSLDRMLAMALGRPLGIEDSDCDAEYPFEYDDEELPQFFSGAPMDEKPPSLMVGFVALVDLYRIAGRVCRRIYGIDSFREHLEPEKVKELTEQAAVLDSELMDWCNRLPATFKSSPTTESQVTMGAVLCSHYYSILTTLHRNFLPLSQSPFQGVSNSIKAVHTARSCIRLAPSVKNVVPQSHHLAFFIQHLFSSAVIILLYAMHISDKEAANAAMAEAESCMGVVSAWEGIWPGARKCRELLSDLSGTAREAISKDAHFGLNPSQSPSPYGGPCSPSSPERSPDLQRAPSSGRVVKQKTIRGKSRDTREARDRERTRSLSVQRSRSSAPGPSGLARRALSQKRVHDEMDHSDLSSSYSGSLPGQPYQSFASGFSSNGQQPAFTDNQLSNTMERYSRSTGKNGERQVSFATTSPVFGPALPSSTESNLSTYSFGLPNSDLNWSNGEMYRNFSQDSDNINTNSYNYNPPNPLPQSVVDHSLLSYGPTLGSMLGLQQPLPGQGNSPPTSSFATPGLPFAGLEFIRNYTSGGFDEQQGGLWHGFDGGEFQLDPDLQFSLGELEMNGHE